MLQKNMLLGIKANCIDDYCCGILIWITKGNEPKRKVKDTWIYLI